MFTEEEIKTYIDVRARLYIELSQMVDIMYQIREGKPPAKSFQSWTLQNMDFSFPNNIMIVTIEFEEYYRGSTYIEQFEFPISYLYIDDWVTDYKKVVKQLQERKAEFKAHKENEENKKKVEAELNLYQKLKEKYDS